MNSQISQVQILIVSPIQTCFNAPKSLEELKKMVLGKLTTESKSFDFMYSYEGTRFKIIDNRVYQTLIKRAIDQGQEAIHLTLNFPEEQEEIRNVTSLMIPNNSPNNFIGKNPYVTENPLGRSTDMVYQPLVLRQIMETRYDDNNRSFQGLVKTQGLKWVAPDNGLEESILTDLICASNGYSKVNFLIVVTMYNEGVKNFKDTMLGIAKNLDAFRSANIPTKSICCVVIVDGMKPFLETYNKQKEFFSQYFDEQKIKNRFNVNNCEDCKLPGQQSEKEFAHCFMQNAIFEDHEPLQLIFCVKQQNKGKLNTHLWFFGGFCEMFNPKYVMLLDVGTKPLDNALFLLYEAMKTDNKIAGCCGEIRPMQTSFWNFVTTAQMVEYKFSHIFDKSLESVIGYITVLPGAFSAYTWEALQGDPLWKHYFKSICHPESMNAYESNILLAEDRVLCLALVSKKDNDFLLRYVKDSIAETDVPTTVSAMMIQRRRWINGSWFSLIDSIKRAASIYESSHSCIRKCCFSIQMIYYLLNVVISWFMVGALFVAFAIAIRKEFDYKSNDDSKWTSLIIMSYYVFLMITFILALGVKPRRVENTYKVIAFIFGLYMILTGALMLKFLIQNLYSSEYLIWLTFITVLAFILTTLCHCSSLTILKGIAQFIFLSPTYVNIFSIYAICNMHDCTWGNRPSQQNDIERARIEKIEKFEWFRTKWLIVWVLCNFVFGYFLSVFENPNSDTIKWYIYIIAFASVGILFMRSAAGIIYSCQEKCCKRRISPYNNQDKSYKLEIKTPELPISPASEVNKSVSESFDRTKIDSIEEEEKEEEDIPQIQVSDMIRTEIEIIEEKLDLDKNLKLKKQK